MTREPIGRHERPWAAHTDADRETVKREISERVSSLYRGRHRS